MEEIRAKLAPGTSVEVWFQDEMRVGQKNKLTYRWARKGSRPRAAHEQRTQSTYLFGAICPERGAGAALVLPACNCEAMQLHLDEIATKVALGAHAIILLDQAGWHGAKALVVPNNISLVPLPARAPAEDALEGDFRSKSDCLRQPILGANQLVSTSSPHSASAPQTSRGTSCITSMTSEPKCFHSAKWWRTCGRLVGFATCLRCLGRVRRHAGGRRFPIKCGNGLLCGLRTRSTEQWGQAEAGLTDLLHVSQSQGGDCGAAQIQCIAQNAPCWPDMNT